MKQQSRRHAASVRRGGHGLGALKTNPPQARYTVGEDAKFLCESARKPDAEVDAIVAGFLEG